MVLIIPDPECWKRNPEIYPVGLNDGLKNIKILKKPVDLKLTSSYRIKTSPMDGPDPNLEA